MRSSLWLLLLSSCASTPSSPPGPGELGLGALRRALALSPAVGHVERDGDAAWLVHDASGVRLARVPDASEPRQCLQRGDGRALAFEGDPGVVLEFDQSEVWLWQRDPAQACLVATPIFTAPADPEWEPIATLWPPEGAAERAADQRAGDAEARGTIALPGNPTPVAVTITPEAATLRHGDNTRALAFPQGRGCGLTGSVMQAPGADGETLVLLTYLLSEQDDLESCADGLGDPAYETTGYVQVAVARDGAMRIIATGTEPASMTEDTSELSRVVDLPGDAFLEFQQQTRPSSGREGPVSFNRWSWSLVMGDQRYLLTERQ